MTFVGGGAGPVPNRARIDDARGSDPATVRPVAVKRSAAVASINSRRMPASPVQCREMRMSQGDFAAKRIAVPVVKVASTR